MASRFPDLLRTALHTCNQRATPLAIGVLIVGGISILMTIFIWGSALKAGVAELAILLDSETAQQVDEQLSMAGPGPQMQQVMMGVMQKLQVKFRSMSTEEQNQMIVPAMGRFFSTVLPLAGSFFLLSVILWLWGRTFFLILGTRAKTAFGPLAVEALTWMLPMLGVWVLTFLALFVWIPIVGILGALLPEDLGFAFPVLGIAGLAYVIYLWPKLALSPALLLHDRTGVIGSLRRSYRVTKGHWFKVFGNLIGAAAMVWIVTFIVQLGVNLLVRIAGAPLLGLVAMVVMMLVGLVGAAYKAVFLVKLKEAIV